MSFSFHFTVVISTALLAQHKVIKPKNYLSLLLLNYFILFQMVDKHGISVILAAIWEGHTECVKVLLKHVSISTGTFKNDIAI